MEKRRLGRTDLDVSVICLGTMTWGQQNTEEEGHAQMDLAIERGVNFFDTAEMYAVPPRAETQGRTEEIIGTWFASRKSRDKVILATKIAGRSPMTWLRDGEKPTEVNRAQVQEAVDKSLKRLQTDYIDLYQIHWPDRPMRLFGGLGYNHVDGEMNAVGDMLDALGDAVEAGKIRHIGLSNETPWGVMSFLKEADGAERPRIQSIQNAYNLVNRTFEIGLSEIAHREQVGLLAYSPIAQGYLSGKYRNGALPEGSRKQLFDRLQRYEGPGSQEAIDAYVELAADRGLDPAQMAQQFVTTRPFVTSNIVGATSVEQLETALGSLDVKWSDELEDAVNAIHLSQPNPCP